MAQPEPGRLCDVGSVEQFTDVADSDHAAYILCMRALGLSEGTGDGAYGPDRELNRGQIATFLVRLWRDVLGRECPSGGSPFTDIDESVHRVNIECLYNLGITKGTTAVTYGPQRSLKDSQIVWFLLRAYQRAGNSCPTGTDGNSEINTAVDCLTTIKVIPDAAVLAGTGPVTRSEMAVYLVGLWHSLSGWGAPSIAPFKGVAVGGAHACGLRVDGSIACWGSNNHNQTDVPNGEYTAVAAGSGGHSCGLRTDGTITCWGNSGYRAADPPDGEYTALAAGWQHVCGLRTDGSIVCWGDNYYGQTDVPNGEYMAVAAGGSISCGVRTDRSIVCWGDNLYGRKTPPERRGGSRIRYAAAGAGGDFACGLGSAGGVYCPGVYLDPQPGEENGWQYTSVAAGGGHLCALRSDGPITCLRDNVWSQANPPEGTYTAVAAGGDTSCAVRTDGTITCWGRIAYKELRGPHRRLWTLDDLKNEGLELPHGVDLRY